MRKSEAWILLFCFEKITSVALIPEVVSRKIVGNCCLFCLCKSVCCNVSGRKCEFLKKSPISFFASEYVRKINIIRTFAAMKLTTKRHIASWVLLAVFLPVLFISSLHIHESAEENGHVCTECVKHQCHGHLSQFVDSMHPCVLCQFLTLTFIAPALCAVALSQLQKKNFYALRLRFVHLKCYGVVCPRAPPVV